MKQLLQNLKTGETSVEDVPVPTPQPGEVLVRTAASLVSAGTERTLVAFAEKSLVGKARSRPDLVRQALDKARREGFLTTLEAALNRLDQPMPLGYSSAGTVIALGAGVTSFHLGQRVACAGGNYAVHAECAAVPQILVTSLPETVDFESAAFTTLGAIALHGFRLAETQLGERVAVIGLGLLGLLTVSLAQAAGVYVLGIDLDPRRVELARSLGAQAVLRGQAGEAAQAFSLGKGCDAVLICADTRSADPVELAGAIARDRAHVVATGAVDLSLPRKIYYEKELSFINSRSYGPGRYDPAYEEAGQDYPIGYVRWTEGRNMQAFVELLASGKVDVRPLITHRFPIDHSPEAYELITGKRQEPFLGVLLTYEVEGSRLKVGRSEPSTLNLQPSTVSLGVLGAGNFATAVMLPALKKIDAIELVGISSGSGLSAHHAMKRFGFRYSGSDEAQVLQDPQVNTVAILTRHHLHARQVIAALQAGKHVFCEKPLALNPQELAEIEETVENYKLKIEDSQGTGPQASNLQPSSFQHSPLLMVGFNRRFAPLAQRMKTFLDSRREPLVAHYRVNAGYIPLNHWVHDPLLGGGRMIGEGCHFVDFLTFLVGAPPVSVVGHGLPDGGRYREDNVVLTFSFPDGSLGTLSYLANGDKSFPKERVEAFAGGRVAVLDDFRSLETVHDGRRQVVRSRLRQDKGHRAEWEAFSAAISTGGPAPIPYAHLLGVTRATFAAVAAVRSGVRIGIEQGG
jgi:predicted dehydrogenase/threonine dehydrogenase-like Zn-dependent dehydrogenase